jgi:hypothetical protein
MSGKPPALSPAIVGGRWRKNQKGLPMDASAKKDYPRALPHRSPDAIAAQAAQMRHAMEKVAAQSARLRRLTYYALGGLALVLAVALTAVLIPRFGAKGARDAIPDSPATLTESRPPNPQAQASELAPAKHAETPASAAKAVADEGKVAQKPESAKETKAPAPAAKPVVEAANAAQKDVFLDALGGLSATHLYQNYLIVGLLADAVESKAISTEGAKNTLKIVADCLKVVDGKLQKLAATDLDHDDRDALQNIKAVTALLRLQSQTLSAYWSTGEMEQADQYQRARKAAWTGLSKVLDLESP